MFAMVSMPPGARAIFGCPESGRNLEMGAPRREIPSQIQMIQHFPKRRHQNLGGGPGNFARIAPKKRSIIVKFYTLVEFIEAHILII